MISFTHKHFDTIGSTQDYAKEMIMRGDAYEGLLISADYQDAGRGRYGRQWLSIRGNLSASLVLKPNVLIECWSQISYVFAVSLFDAIIALGVDERKIALKWVNDILLNGKKLSGILLERVDNYLIVGVGLNIIQAEGLEQFDAISLQQIGCEVDAGTLLEKLLATFAQHYALWQQGGFKVFRSLWLNRCVYLGDEICVKQASREIKGIFVDIDLEGNLVLLQGKQKLLVKAGEMYLLNQDGL